MPFGNDSPLPLHDDVLKRWAQRGYMMDFLKARASVSRSFEVHDFTNSTAGDITNKWTAVASSTATTWAVLAEAGGWQRGVTGASVATGAVGLNGISKFWTGTSGAGFASLIRLSAVTEIRLEQGFADVLPAAGTKMVNLASQAFASTVNAAVYLYDHTGSTTTSGLYTIGTSVAYSAVATTTNRYDSAATLFVAVEVDGTTAKVWVGPPSGGPLAVKHSALTATTGMVPFFLATTASGSKNVDVDCLWTWTLGRV
jgi:hypothetical protein